MQINFNAPDLPLDAAFNVRVRGGEPSAAVLWQMSEVLFRAPDPGAAVSQGGMFGRFGAFGQQWVTLQAPDSFDEKTITLLLEPNLKAALRAVDITEIYGEAIELKDVPVGQAQW